MLHNSEVAAGSERLLFFGVFQTSRALAPSIRLDD